MLRKLLHIFSDTQLLIIAALLPLYCMVISIKLLWVILHAAKDYFDVFILYEGGFGHTIMQSDVYLRYIAPKGLVIVMTTPGRHNHRINLLFGDKMITLSRGALGKKISSLDAWFLWRADKFIAKQLGRINKFIAREIHDVDSLITFAINKGYGYLGRHKSIERLWYEVAPTRHFSNVSKESLETWADWQEFRQITASEESFREWLNDEEVVAFYIRNKGTKEDAPHNFLRSGKKLTDYLLVFEHLKTLGYRILIYGELDENEYLYLKERNLNVVSFRDSPFEKETWDLFAGKFAKFVVGNNGGGLTIPILFGKKILVLDSFVFNHSVPFSLMSYKLVFHDGTPVSPDQFFFHNPLLLNEAREYQVLEQSPGTDLDILKEFLACFNFWPTNDPFTARMHSLCGLSYTPGALVSRVYLKSAGLVVKPLC